MTTQIPDTVFFQNSEYDIIGACGTGLFCPNQHRLRHKGAGSACWRGYVCDYYVDGDSLKLNALHISPVKISAFLGRRPEYTSYDVRGIDSIYGMFDVMYENLAHDVPFSGGLLIGREVNEDLIRVPLFLFREVYELIFEDGKLKEAVDRSRQVRALRKSLFNKDKSSNNYDNSNTRPKIVNEIYESFNDFTILEYYECTDPKKRTEISGLGTRRDPAALELLIDGVSHRSSSVRQSAVNQLMHWQNERAVQPLIVALRDSFREIRRVAAGALGSLGYAQAVEPLMDALADADPSVREKAAEALGWLGDVRAVKPLIEILTDDDETVWGMAAKALGRLEAAEAVLPLIDLLTRPVPTFGHRNSFARRRAAEALGLLRDERAVPPLIEALIGGDNDLRFVSATALGVLGDSRAIDPLGRALKDPDTFVRRAANEALVKLEKVPN
jgi:HEAT repeat protein